MLFHFSKISEHLSHDHSHTRVSLLRPLWTFVQPSADSAQAEEAARRRISSVWEGFPVWAERRCWATIQEVPSTGVVPEFFQLSNMFLRAQRRRTCQRRDFALRTVLWALNTAAVYDASGRAAGSASRLLSVMRRLLSAGGIRIGLARLCAVRETLPGEKRRFRRAPKLLQERAGPGLRLHRGVSVPVQADCGRAGSELGDGPHDPAGPRSAGSVPGAAFYGRVHIWLQGEVGGQTHVSELHRLHPHGLTWWGGPQRSVAVSAAAPCTEGRNQSSEVDADPRSV